VAIMPGPMNLINSPGRAARFTLLTRRFVNPRWRRDASQTALGLISAISHASRPRESRSNRSPRKLQS
jgi:hypothetical protein